MNSTENIDVRVEELRAVEDRHQGGAGDQCAAPGCRERHPCCFRLIAQADLFEIGFASASDR